MPEAAEDVVRPHPDGGARRPKPIERRELATPRSAQTASSAIVPESGSPVLVQWFLDGIYMILLHRNRTQRDMDSTRHGRPRLFIHSGRDLDRQILAPSAHGAAQSLPPKTLTQRAVARRWEAPSSRPNATPPAPTSPRADGARRLVAPHKGYAQDTALEARAVASGWRVVD